MTTPGRSRSVPRSWQGNDDPLAFGEHHSAKAWAVAIGTAALGVPIFLVVLALLRALGHL